MKLVAIISLAPMLLMQAEGAVWAGSGKSDTGTPMSFVDEQDRLMQIGADACGRLFSSVDSSGHKYIAGSVEEINLLVRFCTQLSVAIDCADYKARWPEWLRAHPDYAGKVIPLTCPKYPHGYDATDFAAAPVAKERYPFDLKLPPHTPQVDLDTACGDIPMWVQMGQSPEQITKYAKLCAQNDDVAACHDTLEAIRRYADQLKYPLDAYLFKCKGD